MSLPIPDNKKKKPIPSFDEVMKEQYTPPKIPSYDEVMSESPKKKVGGEGLSGGESGGTTSTTEEKLPTVFLVNGETVRSDDPIALSLSASKLKNAKKEVEMPATNKTGYTLEQVPDEEKIKEYTDTKGEVKKLGYDIDELANEFSDFPEDAFNNPSTSKETLLSLRNTDRISYNQLLNETKNRYAIRQSVANKAAEQVPENAKGGDEYASQMAIRAGNEYIGSERELHPQNMGEFESVISKKQNLINQNLTGEERDKANKRLEETYSIEINPQMPGFMEDFQQSGLEGKIDATQYAGLKTLQVFDPEKYNTYLNVASQSVLPKYDVTINVSPEERVKRAITDPKLATKLGGTMNQNSINELVGQQTVLAELSDIGANNEYISLSREQNNLQHQAKNAQSQEEFNALKAQYEDNEARINDLKKQKR